MTKLKKDKELLCQILTRLEEFDVSYEDLSVNYL